MLPEDISSILLGQALHASRYNPRYSGYYEKPMDAPLTNTEQSVLSFISDGLDLGYCSNPLAYSPTLSPLTKPQRGALLSLIQRGRLVVELTKDPARANHREYGRYGESFLLRPLLA